ncbi:MAG: Holliday junction DNA helicase RuvA [Planctomycetaceae bacterium]|nr:Holliday junction DNA helicase RuvA [Planctomycetaceae bacterium]
MIAQIEGKLVSLDEDKCLVQVGAVCYEVMLPGFAVSALSGRIGEDLVLCTIEYYEGSLGGGNLVPRMVGFLTHGEKEFFRIYTSVKGMGIKKGLKSLSMPVARIADAIESGEEKLLTALPGVGKKMAQQIAAELKGKLIGFALAPAAAGKAAVPFGTFQTEALEILIAWGEKRNEAMELIELACRKHPEIKTAEELVPLVYRIKQGAEA